MSNRSMFHKYVSSAIGILAAFVILGIIVISALALLKLIKWATGFSLVIVFTMSFIVGFSACIPIQMVRGKGVFFTVVGIILYILVAYSLAGIFMFILRSVINHVDAITNFVGAAGFMAGTTAPFEKEGVKEADV